MAKAKKTKKEPESNEPKDRKGFVKMYSPRPLDPDSNQKLVFGHEAESMENGHTVVFVPEKNVANESKRGNALMTKKVYDALFPADGEEEAEE